MFRKNKNTIDEKVKKLDFGCLGCLCWFCFFYASENFPLRYQFPDSYTESDYYSVRLHM